MQNSSGDSFDKKDYLVNKQYADSANLKGRISIHQFYSEKAPDLFWHWLFDNHKLLSGQNVFEAGCGMGDLWKVNASKIPNNLSLTLSDISPGMLEAARAHFPSRPATFQVEDVEALTMGECTFDRSIAHMMIYHAVDKNAALSELKRVTKPLGHIGISTTGDRHMMRVFEVAKSLNSNLDWSASGGYTFFESQADNLVEKHFKNFEKKIWEDRLLVTSAQAVVDYFKTSSANHLATLSEDFFENLRHTVQKEIDSRGAFEIPKRIVFYSCWK